MGSFLRNLFILSCYVLDNFFVIGVIPAVPINVSLHRDETWAIDELDDLIEHVDEEVPLQEREELEREGVQISWDSLYKKLDSLHDLVKRSNEPPNKNNRQYNSYLILNQSLIKRNTIEAQDGEEEYDLGFKEYSQIRKIYPNFEKVERLFNDFDFKKRSVSNQEDNDTYPYDYDTFKAEYYINVENKMELNSTFNYTDNGKPEENISDALNKIIDLDVPKNCSQAEEKQVGVGALRCLTKEKKHNRRWVRLLLRFSLFWLLLYLVMAVCCWCRWGICCCCFAWCCPLCHPKKLINQYQSYLAANPPGVVVQDGRVIHFKATDYENRMYKKIMKHVQRL